MSRINVRPATRADMPLILTLVAELAEYEKLGDQITSDPEEFANHLFGPRPYAEVLIGELDGQANGFALFFHNFSTFLGKPGIYLEDLYVRSETRGSGLGKALLSTLAKLAVDRGCRRLEWSVLDWNEPAIGFYKQLGAHPLEDWTQFRLTGGALRDLAKVTDGLALA
ncbi:GNAT family N-acetyltransferase [Pseudomonas segetis]|uniref:L-amino acid N-acyltransferase YncA n=1 Tax=Pseudomonas segetis TaxID=298908 RepID=A0A239JYR3_9PSED|nr:GNAT family N-acetyltransferase [Pseudomonas segetis]SNT10612.1 L-amino acid N-acyltransferase YncA [Pseudomonas segetis]